MKSTITRRRLAGWIAGAAGASRAASGQSAPAQETGDLEAARAAVSRNRDQIVKVQVRRDVEPSFRFEA
jgi:hypothetical protein